jgi:ketosteroid isomerase-like protein
MKIAALVAILSLTVTCASPPAADDRQALQQVLDKYIQSVNSADVSLASEIWSQSPDLVVVAPFGRFQGWESVRDDVYLKVLQQGFSERNLRSSNMAMEVMGDSAWVVYDWEFTGRRTNGAATTSKGWESQMLRRTERGWRIVHLHYSVPPPLPPS